MLRKLMLGAAALVLLGGLPAARVQAQESEEETRVASPRETRRAESDARAEKRTTQTRRGAEDPAREIGTEERAARQSQDLIRERVRRAIRLPEVVQDSRDAGVPEDKVRDILDSARERDVPAGEVEEILEVENETIRQGGDPDNFGAAVQQMKASGLRGRELAEAIHTEQYARGMKKPKKDKGYKVQGKDEHRGYGDADDDDVEYRDDDSGDEARGRRDSDDDRREGARGRRERDRDDDDLETRTRERAEQARDDTVEGVKERTTDKGGEKVRGAGKKAKGETKSDRKPEKESRGKP